MRVFIIVLVFSIFACQKHNDCEMVETIFAKPNLDSTLILDLNEIFRYSDSVSNKICNRKTNEVLVKVANFYLPNYYDFENFPCGEPPACNMPFRRRNRLEVLLNSDNKLLFENEILELGNLDSSFVIAYLDLNDTTQEHQKKHVINVKWDVESNIDSISKVLQELAIGYSKVIERQLADIEGEKCDFYLQNRHSLQHLYPFKLDCLFLPNLDWRHKIPPPPPPNWVD